MADPVPTICLALVVRDDGRILHRCLDSVRNLIDSWVIVDTGSAGNIREMAADKLDPLPGQFLSESWAGYAHHRNQAFKAAAARADWVLVMDADETLLTSDLKALKKLDRVLAAVEIRSRDHSVVQPRLIGGSIKGCYVGDPVERLIVPEGQDPPPPSLLLDGWVIVHHADGCRARDLLRKQEGAQRLISSTIDSPNDQLLFCDIADLCFDLGDWRMAHRCYLQCADLHPGGDFGWYARYRAARALEMLSAPFDEVLGAYHQAFESCPLRAETLYRMAALSRRNGRLPEAFDLARMAVETPLTCRGFYFERPVYDYLARIEWARCFFDRGDRDAAQALFDLIGALPTLPADWRQWIEKTIARARAIDAGVKNDQAAKPDLPPPPPLAKTPRGKQKKMTIGMATYDDFDGVFFTAMAIHMYHPEVTEETEILVIDNHPGGSCSEALKALDARIPGYRYLPVEDYHGTGVRDRIFAETDSQYVLCVDSHVLIQKGGIRRLLDYFGNHPDCRNLLHGTLCREDGTPYATHMEPVWRKGMLGTWGYDPRGAEPELPPFEIPLQGLGLFACRRDAWPGFNPRFSGFGGEEGYLHEKARLAGNKSLCLPFLRWLHRFSRPEGPRYQVRWEDRIRNYLIAYEEIGLDPAPVRIHFSELLGEEETHRIVAGVETELRNPFHFFDAIYCINLDTRPDRWQAMLIRFEALGIAHRVRRFRAIPTPDNHHAGCALSHRGIIETAARQKLKSVLILEDDTIFLDDTLSCLSRSIAELRTRPWNLFYLGGHQWGTDGNLVEGCQHLKTPALISCSHAIGINNQAFAGILADVPVDQTGMEIFLRTYQGIDQYFSQATGGLFLASPAVASQPSILAQEKPMLRTRFIL